MTTIVLGGLMPKIIKCVLGNERPGNKSEVQAVAEDEGEDEEEDENRLAKAENQRRLMVGYKKIKGSKKDKKDKKMSFFKYSD